MATGDHHLSLSLSTRLLLLMTLFDVFMVTDANGQSGSSGSSSSVTSSGMRMDSTTSTIRDENKQAAMELRRGSVSELLSQLISDTRQRSASSMSVSGSSFIQQVTNRTALCRLLNGTCVVPANCAVLGLSLGYDLGRGTSSAADVEKYFTCDSETPTVCCYPFILSNLFAFPTRRHPVNHVDDDELEGFETVHEYWYPTYVQRRRRQRRPRSKQGGRRRRYDEHSMTRYRTDRRQPFSRRSRADSLWHYEAADVDGVNYTAVCEGRGGICTRAADCPTNSAVDLTGTGSRFATQVDQYGDNDTGDQIRSFLCNLTAICCLPQPATDPGGWQVADAGSSLGRQITSEFSSVLCALVNGTCVSVPDCISSGFTGAPYRRTINLSCNRTTICCLR